MTVYREGPISPELIKFVQEHVRRELEKKVLSELCGVEMDEHTSTVTPQQFRMWFQSPAVKKDDLMYEDLVPSGGRGRGMW